MSTREVHRVTRNAVVDELLPQSGSADLKWSSASSPALCLVTRIQVQRLWHLLVVVVSFRRMRRQSREVVGLLDVSIRLRAPRTAILVSLWAGREAIDEFESVVLEHPHQVRWLRKRHALVWSGIFELADLSKSSVHTRWRGFGAVGEDTGAN